MRLSPLTPIAFIVQQILIFPITFLLTGPIMRIYGSSLTNSHGPDGRSNIPDAVVCAIVAGTLGFGLASFRKTLAHSGCWIWVLPTTLFIWAILGDGPNPFFYATAANEGLGVMFFTLPTFSCIGYSLGMLISRYFSTRKMSPEALEP
jgi:hypothetical protein